MTPSAFTVVVLTCGDLGYETASALSDLDVISRLAVVRAPPWRPATLAKRLKINYRRHGLWGTIARMAGKAYKLLTRTGRTSASAPSDANYDHLEVRRFEDEEGLAVLHSLSPDLAVVDGTYILPASVFSLPRIGTINLHCGYLPDYKGAPPAFWELFDGRDSVGVTVHFVTADLDGGPIIARRSFPLDPAPSGDPMEYVDSMWHGVLRPAGLDMICDVVRQAATDVVESRPQKASAGQTFKWPTYREVKELRRRVQARRTRGSVRS